MRSRNGCIETFILDSKHKDIDKRFEEYSIQIFEIIQRVLKEKPKDKVLFQIVVQPTGEKQLFWALSALLKTARLEYSKFIGQMIGIESDESLDEIFNKINVNKFNLSNKEIKYQDGRRFVCQWTQLDKPEQVESMPWRDNGVYLITGGAGKLGLIFSKEIAERVENPILILTGRSPLNESRLKELEELEKLGATVRYQQMNVANRQDVRMVIQSIKNQYGNINGIIHAAGLIQDNFIVKKTQKELKNVLAPKVTGLVNMDLESKDMNLDFILLFSSGAGAMGNMGQIDYSAANAFMDQFASYRNELVSSKQRYGRTLAINWPLWKSGGLHVDEENEKLVMRNTGMVAMKSSRGIKAFYRCFSSTKEQIMVLEGRYKMLKDKINAINDSEGVQALNSTPLKEARVVIDKDNLFEKVQTDLAKTVSMLLKVKIQDIDLEGELSEYGFDSISLTQFINKLNEQYKLELAPTIFFEYSTLHSFAKYLTDEYEEVLASKFGVRKVVDVPVQEKETYMEKYVYIKEESVHMDKGMEKYKLIQETPTSKSIHREQEPIAIVGISGIFPQSKDIDMFWDNLVNGRDCITEIPKERWDYKEYYGDPSKEDNKTNVKWGGFIELSMNLIRYFSGFLLKKQSSWIHSSVYL
nr:beta-ketoacyl reductase [Ruminiclostridium josui]